MDTGDDRRHDTAQPGPNEADRAEPRTAQLPDRFRTPPGQADGGGSPWTPVTTGDTPRPSRGRMRPTAPSRGQPVPAWKGSPPTPSTASYRDHHHPRHRRARPGGHL